MPRPGRGGLARRRRRGSGKRKAHADSGSGPVQARPDADVGAVALGDALDDREAEPAAARAAGGVAAPDEAVEYVLAVGGRNARPRVAHAQERASRLGRDADVDAASFRCIAQGIVDEVGQ